MKKVFAVLPIVAVLAACSTTSNSFDKQANDARERQEKYVAKSLDNVPDWMTNPPENTSSVVYATGSAVSGDMAMADEKAKALAAGKICTSAGGTVDKTSKVYMRDSNGQTQEQSELAIRSKCRQIDVTGVQTVKIKRIAEGTRYRTYVLVALPLGDANILKQEKVQAQDRLNIKEEAEKAFREMDDDNNKSVVNQPTSKVNVRDSDGNVKTVDMLPISDPAVKAKRDEALNKPGAVYGQVTVPM